MTHVRATAVWLPSKRWLLHLLAASGALAWWLGLQHPRLGGPGGWLGGAGGDWVGDWGMAGGDWVGGTGGTGELRCFLSLRRARERV